MLIVGEKLNSSLKGIEEAVRKRDGLFIQNLAKRQIEAGANALDVNVGTSLASEDEDMRWMVKTIQQVVDCPLLIDSPNPRALRAGLEECKGRVIINSITAERERMGKILPLAVEFKCGIVALTMDEKGIPKGVEERMKIAKSLISILTRKGISLSDIYIDPMVTSIATESSSAKVTFETTRRIMSSFKGIHTICGLSNISFGLPKRRLLNQTFFVMAICSGMDSFILDPLDRRLMSLLVASRALLGEDEYCADYIKAFRQGRI